MITVIFGLICFLLVGFAIIPFSIGLNWTDEFLFVLKGGIPFLVLIVGFLCLVVGIADLIDSSHAKKEAKIQEEFDRKQEQNK